MTPEQELMETMKLLQQISERSMELVKELKKELGVTDELPIDKLHYQDRVNRITEISTEHLERCYRLSRLR